VQRIYCDYNATTPLDRVVREALFATLERGWANPSSIHHFGREARELLDDARYRMARLWACKPSEVVFTSGGTEANNLAILGAARLLRAKGRHLVTSAIEHHAVLHTFDYLQRHEGFEVTRVPVDPHGQVDPDSIRAALRPDTTLVSVMAANNEVGTVQPVADIGRLCRDRGVLFHTDAVQAAGKLPFANIHQFNADLVAVCAHKFHGPKGAGALFIRSPLLPHPTFHGGGQENERRAGTENLPSIVGLADAFERFVPTPVFEPGPMRDLTESLANAALDIPGVHRRGHPSHRLPNTISFSVEGADAIALLANLDLEGICASSGSACSAGSLEPSHVLQAMGVPSAECNALLRFSFGRENTLADAHRIAEVLPVAIARARG
jgi:cysteine desulfurase